jgi:hypothetical protein
MHPGRRAVDGPLLAHGRLRWRRTICAFCTAWVKGREEPGVGGSALAGKGLSCGRAVCVVNYSVGRM